MRAEPAPSEEPHEAGESATPEPAVDRLAIGLDDARRLFEVMAIGRMVCVDDVANRAENDLRVLVAASVRDFHIELAIAKELLIKFGCQADLDTLDADSLADAILDDSIGVPRGALLALQGAVVSTLEAGDVVAHDESAVGVLQQIAVDAGLDFVLVDLDTWNQHRTEYVVAGTMILFDRDMTGDDSGTTETGEQLLLSVAQAGVDGVIAGLFTESVSPGGEFEAWTQLSAKHPDLADRLLVVSKGVIDPLDPGPLVGSLKLLATAPRLQALVAAIKGDYLKNANEAIGMLELLSPYTLDRLFVGAIEDEGEWGPETFQGYLDAEVRRRLRKALRDNPAISEVIADLRQLASTTATLPPPSLTEIRNVQRMKTLDDDSINEIYLPIDTGDIFQFFKTMGAPPTPWTGTLWMLATQQCDVVIRGTTGKRNYDPSFLTMIRLDPVDESSDRATKPSKFSYRLPFLTAPVGKVYIANLLDKIAVPAMALDLCAFSPVGLSTLDVAHPPDINGLSQASEASLKRYVKRGLGMLAKFTEAAKETKSAALLELATASLTMASEQHTHVTSKIDKDAGAISFGVQRLARLREPTVLDIVDQLASIQGRVALDARVPLA